MALLQDINNTYISYSGRRILPNSRFKKCTSIFVIDIYLEIDFIHGLHNTVMFQKYKQKDPIVSTNDVRWILKKLYND
jgi:hypothetical protein